MFAENIIAFVVTATALTMAPGLDTAMGPSICAR